MKLFSRIALAVFLLFVLAVAGILGRLFLYQGDLPDIGRLAQFAPDAPRVVTDPCLTRSIAVVPGQEVTTEMRAAVSSAEREELRPYQIAMSLVCPRERPSNLTRAINEYRLVWHIHRRFNKDQLLTIYLNRVQFTKDTIGVAEASCRFFGKEPKELTLAEAALLAGMIRAPIRFSPYKYPDAALQRRNQVIEVMRAQGTISPEEAATAEAKPLGVLSQTSN